MTMRLGDYALRPTFAEEKGGRSGEENGEIEGRRERAQMYWFAKNYGIKIKISALFRFSAEILQYMECLFNNTCVSMRLDSMDNLNRIGLLTGLIIAMKKQIIGTIFD